MLNKLILFSMSIAVLCTLFVGCDEDRYPTGTTDSDATKNTTEWTVSTITTETDATIPGGHTITYTEFESMTGDQQKNVISKFESKEQFDNWYDEVKEDYEEYIHTSKPSTEPTEYEKPYFPEATDITAQEKDVVTYQDYHNMTAKEQKAFLNSFASFDDFFEWHDAAFKAYQDSLIVIDGTTPIDAEDIFGTTDGSN